jgi:(4-(4-[2-(gamma-L-glutamylamino)ethyl]phenoxymethyl)furan-2-yl)methanamine synthase
MAMPDAFGVDDTVGWDIGGAHVKACVLHRGEVVDVAQWACPLWQGMEQLDATLRAAHLRWPNLGAMRHAATMTGEMVDLFAHREDGVQRIAQALAQALAASTDAAHRGAVHFHAGDAGWCVGANVAEHWEAIASANWLATARHAALRFGEGAGAGVLVDIGSTTTDLIAFKAGRVLTRSRTDAQRLARGELVYQGVVRTPLCALAQRIAWCGTPHNVMNEFFATTADVYRLTGELNPAHDLYPSADSAAKDLPATRQRLARMVGLDARDGTIEAWAAFARSWREAQVTELGGQLRRVIETHRLSDGAVVVGAGCGDFLVRDVLVNADAGAGAGADAGADASADASADATADAGAAARAGPEPTAPRRLAVYGSEVARVSAHARAGRSAVEAWAQVCAPSVAVAALFDLDHR